MSPDSLIFSSSHSTQLNVGKEGTKTTKTGMDFKFPDWANDNIRTGPVRHFSTRFRAVPSPYTAPHGTRPNLNATRDSRTKRCCFSIKCSCGGTLKYSCILCTLSPMAVLNLLVIGSGGGLDETNLSGCVFTPGECRPRGLNTSKPNS